jgi:predicted nucleotidyltransferase
MHEQLLAAEQALGITLHELGEASSRTAQNVLDVQRAVSDSLKRSIGDAASGDVGLDILAFGSMAREEMVVGSDFDYLVVAHELQPDPTRIRQFRQAAEDAFRVLMAERPGTSGLFGVMVASPDLVNVIGLNDDTNKSLSRRLLVLQESVALNKHDNRDRLTNAILKRYLADYEGLPAPRVPRFLLNDMLRYWRTVGVDYQAKRWEEMEGKKWGLRYLKLRSSRKWAFAGGLMAPYMPVVLQEDTTALTLSEQFEMPPLARLAQLHALAPAGSQACDGLTRVLKCADDFIGLMQNEVGFREEAQLVKDPGADDLPDRFRQAREITVELQSALEDLFFSDTPLGPANVSLGSLSRKYLSF